MPRRPSSSSRLMEVKIEVAEAPLHQPSAPKPRRPTPDHPPYAEMVRVALRELAEEGGSTEASISGYIRSNYIQLPPGHSRLLPYYLGKLVAAGDVSMLSPDRFALPLALAPPPPTWSHHFPVPNPGPRRSSSAPRIPRRRGRPPKRKRTSASGSAVGLMLPPWPRSPHHATDANAPPPPPPRRGRGRPRKNPENAVHSGAKVPCAAEPAARPRLIVRLRSRPPNPIPDTVAGDDASGTMTTTAQAIGWRCSEDGMVQKPDGKPSSANANIEEESALLALMQPEPAPLQIKEEDALPPPASALAAALQLELKGALLPSASPPASWRQAEPDEEPAPPSLLLPETNEPLWPVVALHSEPDVEMLLLDQMQPEPEGGLLLLRPEPEPLPLARKQPESNDERSLLTPLHPATMRPEFKEESSPPAAQPDAWLVASPAKPEAEPLAPGQLQLEAKEPKGETLSLECDESYFGPVSVDPEPCKELVLLDATQPNLEEEFLQLLPLQSDTELELLPLPAPTQSELHGEQILSISAQPEPGEQLAIDLTEVSPHLQLCGQPELSEGFSHHPEPNEGSFPTLMQMEPREELLPLAAIEPEGEEGSSPPAPVLAVEKDEKNEYSSKQRRIHVKHRRLWFEC